MNTTANVAQDRNGNTDYEMTVEEALQVPWLSYNAKPLGELMDEGYLDTSRLEWAAQKAYNPRLKLAAQVLLAWEQDGAEAQPTRKEASGAQMRRDVGISLEKAEATLWPFGQYRGEAMGALVRSRRLSLKDLGYAIESAWEDRVRRAAIALSLLWLDQAIEEGPSEAGPLNVVTGGERSYAQRRQIQIATLQGGVTGALLALALAFLVNSFLHATAAASPRLTFSEVLASPELTLALAIIVLGVVGFGFLEVFGINLLMKRMDQSIEAYRKGEAGEDAVVEKARRALDGNWTLFRNVVLPGKKADLDIVLVGPPGVWVLEVKTMLGAFKNVGEAWAYRSGGRWRHMGKNPGRQARRGALALKDFLGADGICTYVHDALVWAEPEAAVFQENPTVPVWRLDRLEDELGNLVNGRPLTEEDRAGIVEELARLCKLA